MNDTHDQGGQFGAPPPQSPPVAHPTAPGRGGPPPPFTFSNAFSEGWEIFKRHYGPLLIVTLVYIALTLGISLVLNVLQMFIAAAVILQIPVAIFISIPLWAGSMWVGIRAYRASPSLEDLFRAFSGAYYGRIILMGLLYYLAIIILMIPMFIVMLLGAIASPGGAGDALLAIMVALLVIASIAVMVYLLVRLMFALAFPLDPFAPPKGLIDTFKLSWRMTEGPRGWTLFAVYLVAGLIAGLSFVACVLPAIFFGIPLFIAIIGASYAMLASEIGIGPMPLRRKCASCGYDLTGVPDGQCPECGWQPSLRQCTNCGRDLSGLPPGPCPECGAQSM